MNRRGLLSVGGAAALGTWLVPGASRLLAGEKNRPNGKGGKKAMKVVKNGRLKQSVSRWCYGKMPLDELCKAAADIGLAGIDLLDEAEWEVPGKYGLACSMAYAGANSIPDGLNNKANHDAMEKRFRESIPKAGKLKLPNVIAFFGNRRGMSDREAIDNCVTGLNRVKKIAEDSGVNICVELLNSKVDHKDYQGDRSSFGLEVVKAVNSPRVKLLFDIYHVQIMEGDIIRTIRDHHDWIGHYHTGGVPGRHEIDDTQELNWRTVAKAIVDTGFTGFFAHEFVPAKPDKLQSLREAAAICDV